MSEVEQHKRPSQKPSEESLRSKKTKAVSSSSTSPMSMALVKLEPVEGQVEAQGSGGPRARAATAEQSSPAAERERVNVSLEVHLFHCDAAGCYGRLEPPVFRCEAGHLLCDACRGEGHCRNCNRAAVFARCPEADSFVTCATVPCPYEAAGCNGAVPYHAIPAHRETCAYAPCCCLELSCAFAADHGWTALPMRPSSLLLGYVQA